MEGFAEPVTIAMSPSGQYTISVVCRIVRQDMKMTDFVKIAYLHKITRLSGLRCTLIHTVLIIVLQGVSMQYIINSPCYYKCGCAGYGLLCRLKSSLYWYTSVFKPIHISLVCSIYQVCTPAPYQQSVIKTQMQFLSCCHDNNMLVTW